MKRALLVIILVTIVAGVLLLARRSKPAPWKPGTTMTFLGFIGTNATLPGTNAWLGIQSVPKETTTWRVIEIRQHDGTNWVAWDPLPPTAFTWLYPQPTNYALGAIVPMPSTSAPVRIVTELSREPQGAGLFFRGVRQFVLRLLRKPITPATGARDAFYITNEINTASR